MVAQCRARSPGDRPLGGERYFFFFFLLVFLLDFFFVERFLAIVTSSKVRS